MRHIDRWEAGDRELAKRYAGAVLADDDYESPDADDNRKPYAQPAVTARDHEHLIDQECRENPYM